MTKIQCNFILSDPFLTHFQGLVEVYSRYMQHDFMVRDKFNLKIAHNSQQCSLNYTIHVLEKEGIISKLEPEVFWIQSWLEITFSFV